MYSSFSKKMLIYKYINRKIVIEYNNSLIRKLFFKFLFNFLRKLNLKKLD